MQHVHTQLTSVEKRLDDMDVMGIDMQAISPAPVQMFYWTEPDLGIASARLVNDNIAEIVGRHPPAYWRSWLSLFCRTCFSLDCRR